MHKITKHNFVTIAPNVSEGQSMIILGDRHQFSGMEIDQLGDRFDTIDHISYKNMSAEETINLIEGKISDHKKHIILLNTQAQISDTLLNYLVSLESRGIRYITTESFLEKYLHKCYIPNDQTDIGFLERIRPYNTFQSLLKFIIDLFVVLSLLIPALLSGFVAAFFIRRQSPGPIFFRQTRVGKNGKRFTCYKFRSMHEDSHHNPYTKEDDDRIFPWGNIMRKTRIDELPQLWNVAKRDMHILGPRAEWDILVEKYEKEIPYYNERHIVRPGITGWAQVNYPYGENTEDARQKLMYDLYYIKHWNLWIEIKTALLTVKVVLGKMGR